MFGLLLSMLDGLIVGTAAPTIVADLQTVSHLPWVVTAYALTSAVSTPVWAELGGLFGRKRMFQLSVSVFVVGSVLAAAAPTMGLLVAARAVQGVGAGGLAVGAFAVIGDLVPPAECGRYQGLTAIVVAAGTIGGPLVGGFVTDGLGWRWAFLVNLPLGAVTVAWVGLLLRLPVVPRRARIDWAGAGLLGTAIAALVLLTSWAGSTVAWASAPSAALAATVLLSGAAFEWRKRRAAEPLVPLTLFASRSFTMASLLALASGVIMLACVLYSPLFQQTVQGASASGSGLLLLPMMVPVVVMSQVLRPNHEPDRALPGVPIVGALSSTIGAALLASMTPHTRAGTTAVFMVLMGIGSGLSRQLTTTIAQNSVSPADIGAASGVITLLRTIGGSVAVSGFGTVYVAHTASMDGADLRAGATDGIRLIFLLIAAVAALSLVAAAAVKEIPLPRTGQRRAPAVTTGEIGPLGACTVDLRTRSG